MIEFCFVHLFEVEVHDSELIVYNNFLVSVIEIPGVLDSFFEDGYAEVVVFFAEGALHKA